jgi:hypothetical protein
VDKPFVDYQTNPNASAQTHAGNIVRSPTSTECPLSESGSGCIIVDRNFCADLRGKEFGNICTTIETQMW